MITLEQLSAYQDKISNKATLELIDIIQKYELDAQDETLTRALVSAFVAGGTTAIESLEDILWD